MSKPLANLVAVLSGGDWSDASVDHLVVPEGTNEDDIKKGYSGWLSGQYWPNQHTRHAHKFLTMAEWMVKYKGCRFATIDEVGEIDNT